MSTRGGQFRLRADRISALGLENIHTRGGLPPFPVLEWKDVARIERRTSRFRTGQVIGGLAGVPLLYFVVPPIAGAWLGARLGDSMVRTTTLYEGDPLVPEPERTIIADSQRTVIANEDAVETTAVERGSPPDLNHIGRTILRNRQVHMWGSFGEFTGTVDAIDPVGLHGLHPRRPPDGTPNRPPDPVAWSQISGMYYRGHSGGRGAAYGAVLLGSGTGALAAALTQVSFGLGTTSNSSADAIGAFFAGAAAGGLVGAGLGYLVGSAFKDWRPVPGFHVSAMPAASKAEPAPTSGARDQAREP